LLGTVNCADSSTQSQGTQAVKRLALAEKIIVFQKFENFCEAPT
jgi:hypothetical protein